MATFNKLPDVTLILNEPPQRKYILCNEVENIERTPRSLEVESMPRKVSYISKKYLQNKPIDEF